MFRERRLPDLDIWGGIECTRNRVGDRFFDQIKMSGHDERIADLDQIADLGISVLRYPVLWEQAVERISDPIDWSWTDQRLTRLRQLGISPIATLVHHGSGPYGTSLLESSFATGLADYAAKVAERYPWIGEYTPVNEPLTTARFSGLYGYWYPHRKDGLSFARCFLNECRATILAMQAIRRIQPNARLIQTEDIGHVTSTQKLAYQADFENERRWLTFDLLCGRVDSHHPIGSYFRWLGITEGELNWFQENQTPPDVLGMNYYITSERYLDHRIDHYPSEFHGGNGKDAYADVELVRVSAQQLEGPTNLLMQLWDRYGLPLAITEAHLGCSREDQMRWLLEIWQAAQKAKSQGADVRAMTAWSLLGSCDWNSLLTRQEGYYEPGAWDIRSSPPRHTALAGMIRDLAAKRHPRNEILHDPGWWRRPERIVHVVDHPHEEETSSSSLCSARPILIVGARGMLGSCLLKACQERGITVTGASRDLLELTDITRAKELIDQLEPWAVINAAGTSQIGQAEQFGAECYRDNCTAASILATQCALRDIPYVMFSSDLVVRSRPGHPAVEKSPTNPWGVFGHAKALSEAAVLARQPGALIIRTSALFDLHSRSILNRQLCQLHQFGSCAQLSDSVVSHTYAPDLANAALDLLIDGEQGIWHLTNQGELTWAEAIRLLALRTECDPDTIVTQAIPSQVRPLVPAYSVLRSARGELLPSCESALDRFAFRWRSAWHSRDRSVEIGRQELLAY